MNYIDEIAERIYLVNDPTGEISAEDMELHRIYAVLALTRGENTSRQDVHNAWSAWAASWQPAHGSLVPFWRLKLETQMSDQPYVDAIRTVAREMRERAGRVLVSHGNGGDWF